MTVLRVLTVSARELTITPKGESPREYFDLTVAVMRGPNQPKEELLLRLDKTQMQILRHALEQSVPPLDMAQAKPIDRH